MKKLQSFLLIPLLALASCSKTSIYGTYSFKLGKPAIGDQPSTEIGVSITLDDEEVKKSEEDKESLGKHLHLDLEAPPSAYPKEPEAISKEWYELTFEDIETIFEYSAMMLLLENGVSGYFQFDEETEVTYDSQAKPLGKRMVIGLEFEDSQEPEESQNQNVLNAEEEEEPIIPTSIIPSEIFEEFLCAYKDSNFIKLIIPVSLNDLIMQLCWYGIFINVNAIKELDIDNVFRYLSEIHELPKARKYNEKGGYEVTDNRIGTHPTQDDIEKMNTYYAEVFTKSSEEKPFFTFRDFNVLTLDLMKE